MATPLTTVMAAGRIGFGALSWVAPDATNTVSGLRGPAQPIFSRLFASRDIALGAAVLAQDPAVRRRALQLGVAVDLLDLVASMIDMRKGRTSTWGKAVLLGGGLGWAGMGLAALAQEK
ncbi:MAG: hypothetical protein ACT4P1_13175 [Sporichthyaceae bacterium]